MSDVYLAGYDGSEASRRAVALAVRLARAANGTATVLTAYPGCSPETEAGLVASCDAAVAVDAARRSAEDLLADLDVEGIGARRATPGSAAQVLATAAEHEGAQLIAVGATHRGAMGRLLPGSVAERLLHGAPCPVAVVPGDGSHRTLGSFAVGVAYDGSPEAEAALAYGHDLAERHGARLRLIVAAEPIVVGAVGLGIPTVYDDGSWKVRARELVDRAAAGTQAESRVVRGPAGPALAAACADEVDVLVCGSRSYGPLRSVLAGSVSRYLVDHAPCPVIVVPRGAWRSQPTHGTRSAETHA